MGREGNFDSTEYAIYDALCESLMANSPIKGIVYLKCSPEVCLARIKQRGRKGEEGIDIDYLTKVHIRHESWIEKQKEKIPVLVVDTGNLDIYDEENKEEVSRIIQSFV